DLNAVSRHIHVGGTARDSLFIDPLNHALACGIDEGLAWQPGTGESGRNDDDEAGHQDSRSSVVSVRASLSSMTGTPSRIGNARRSVRRRCACSSRSYLRAALHSGQARMLSSFLSTLAELRLSMAMAARRCATSSAPYFNAFRALRHRVDGERRIDRMRPAARLSRRAPRTAPSPRAGCDDI